MNKNQQQFNHNIKKAKRQRTAENNIKTQILDFPGFSKIMAAVDRIEKLEQQLKAENDLHIQIMSDRLQNNYENLIDYIDFKKICKDFKLRAGDLTPSQQGNIEQILKEFIKQNSSFYEI
jgi:hypothetical protein